MKKLSNTEADLKKNFAYKKKRFIRKIFQSSQKNICVAISRLFLMNLQGCSLHFIKKYIQDTSVLLLLYIEQIQFHQLFNLLSANPIKRSNTLKQFVGNSQRIISVVWSFCGVGT